MYVGLHMILLYLTGYLSHPHTAQSILGSILASCCWWMLTSMAFSTFTVDAGIIRGYAQKMIFSSTWCIIFKQNMASVNLMNERIDANIHCSCY